MFLVCRLRLEGCHGFIHLLTDTQWSLIEELLPSRTGKKGRPFGTPAKSSKQSSTGIGAELPGETCPRCSGRGRQSGPGIDG